MPEEKTPQPGEQAQGRKPAPAPEPLGEEPEAMPMPHEPGDENAQPG